MNKQEFQKIVDFIEGYYHRQLEKNELKALKEEVSYCKDYDDFINKFKFPLLKKVEYFTVQQLHNLIEEDKEMEAFKQRLGISSFDELYEN